MKFYKFLKRGLFQILLKGLVLTLFIGLSGCGSGAGTGATEDPGDPGSAGDVSTLDTDNDGILDVEDNCPTVANADQANEEVDGVGDACDNCPKAPNPDQSDLNGDGEGDRCDPDIDGDGKANLQDLDNDADGKDDVLDNCFAVPNPDQADADGDGIGDACEAPIAAKCALFPPDNPWNADISDPAKYPKHPMSDTYMAAIAGGVADFNGQPYTFQLHPGFTETNMPVNYATVATPLQPVTCVANGFCQNSDIGSSGVSWPMPAKAQIQYPHDRHLVVLDQDSCLLYETFATAPDPSGNGFLAGSGSIYDLKTNALHPYNATFGIPTATASGLPLYPGLIKYEEIASGGLHHALMMSVPNTQYKTFALPAIGWGSNTNQVVTTNPPMGTRLRLKPSYAIPAGFHPQTKAILQALKTYGAFINDNNLASGHVAGAGDPRWNFGRLVMELHKVPVTEFEVVDTSVSCITTSTQSGSTVNVVMTCH